MYERLNEMAETIRKLEARIKALELIENQGSSASGPYVLRTGDTMTGQLNIDPTSGAAGGLLRIEAPSAISTSTYIFRFYHNGTEIMRLRDDGQFLLNQLLIFGTSNKGIYGNSSGAKITFPDGGASNTGNIDIDTSGSNGGVKAVSLLTAIGNGCAWSYDGVAGTAVDVVKNGTDDVLYVLSGQFVIRDSAGNVAGGQITATAPSGTFNLYDDGGTNTCQLQVNADGSVTVQRTAGSRTYKVMLFLVWL